MITINKETILNFEPCRDRLDNYLENYSDFSGTLDEFLELRNISYYDKIWVGVRLLTFNQRVHFAILCADSVSHLTDDKSVKEFLDYLKSIPDFSELSKEQEENILSHKSAHAFAFSYASASYASASHASASASASYASASASASASNDGRELQEKLNLEFLKVAASL